MSRCKHFSPAAGGTRATAVASAMSLASGVYLPSEVQRELELGRPLAVYAQLQEGVRALKCDALGRGCSRYCGGHQSVTAIRSVAGTGAGATTSDAWSVARCCQVVEVGLYCNG